MINMDGLYIAITSEVQLYESKVGATACESECFFSRIITDKEVAARNKTQTEYMIKAYRRLIDSAKQKNLTPIYLSLDEGHYNNLILYTKFNIFGRTDCKVLTGLFGIPVKIENGFPKLYINTEYNGKKYLDFLSK